MTDVTYSVPEMHCGACETSIRTAVGEIPGVDHVGVDLSTRQVTVTFDEDRTTGAAIRERIERAGFDVE